MRQRIQKVRKLLRQEKADALIVSNSEGCGQPATAWLSGFTGTSSILLITRNRHYLITDGRYASQSKEEAVSYTIFITSPDMPVSSILQKLSGTHALKRVMFDGTETLQSFVEDAQTHFKGVTLLSKRNVLQELRLVKEKREIELLTAAAKISIRAFRRLIPEIRQRLSERELAWRLERLCFEEGADSMAFPTIVASGKNGALPHATPTHKPISAGELVTIDFGVRKNGYVSDLTRTVGVGRIPPRLRKVYEAVRIAEEQGCRKARGGLTGGEIDALCRKSLKKQGLEKYFTHATGHGVGMEVHELPQIYASHRIPIPAGTVITCEPGVYIPNVGGVRIEDMLVLTKRGNVNLTKGLSTSLITLHTPEEGP